MKKTKTKPLDSRPLSLIQCLFLTLLVCVPGLDLPAQSGGGFEMRQSVVAGGGGSSSGGTLSLSGTSGQIVANSSSGLPYSLRSGFWQGDFGPSAALVTVSGRVTTAEGSGIRNVRVSLTDQTGVVRTALTGSFGHYRFDDIEAGQTVVLSIAAKRYVFASPTRIVTVQEELADIDFTAEP